MKKWRDEIAEAPLLSPSEMQAKVEQLRALVEEGEFTYETFQQVSDLEGEIRLLVCAMIVRGTTSQEQAARTALMQLGRLYPQAVRKVKRLYAKQVLAERKAQKADRDEH